MTMRIGVRNPRMLALGAAVGALCGASPAFAFSLNPPGITSQLTGKLLFTPHIGTPFQCKVRLKLKTSKYRISVAVAGQGCSVSFASLPWGVNVAGMNSGTINGGAWGGGGGECSQSITPFTVNHRGVWSIPAGSCISGTLTSDPPVTITK